MGSRIEEYFRTYTEKRGEGVTKKELQGNMCPCEKTRKDYLVGRYPEPQWTPSNLERNVESDTDELLGHPFRVLLFNGSDKGATLLGRE